MKKKKKKSGLYQKESERKRKKDGFIRMSAWQPFWVLIGVVF
jgi:hypothetical protein